MLVDRGGRNVAQGQPNKKEVSETLSLKKKAVIPDLWEAEIGWFKSEDGPGHVTPSKNKLKGKKGWGMAQG
jgi:hypothetical protein